MKKKNWQSVIAAVVIAFSFAGCNSAEPVSEKVEQGEVNQKEEMKEGSKVKASFVQEAGKKDSDSGQEEEKLPDTEESSQTETETGTETDTEINTEGTEELPEDEGDAAIEDTFDYVAVGNSVTCNDPSELWWSNWGMAATTEDNDYVHVLSRWLAGQVSKPVTTTVVSIKDWEVAPDRMAALEQYTEYFNEYTDLVTLQTGENITEGKETLGEDYPALVQMIKEKAPNAQILMLGTVLWSPKEEIENPKREACAQNGIPYIDVTDFRAEYDNNTFRSALGTQVYGSDGSLHTIEDEVVAAHPNDAGMANIAQHFINYITLP